jgi:hypothetical protein
MDDGTNVGIEKILQLACLSFTHLDYNRAFFFLKMLLLVDLVHGTPGPKLTHGLKKDYIIQYNLMIASSETTNHE